MNKIYVNGRVGQACSNVENVENTVKSILRLRDQLTSGSSPLQQSIPRLSCCGGGGAKGQSVF